MLLLAITDVEHRSASASMEVANVSRATTLGAVSVTIFEAEPSAMPNRRDTMPARCGAACGLENIKQYGDGGRGEAGTRPDLWVV